MCLGDSVSIVHRRTPPTKRLVQLYSDALMLLIYKIKTGDFKQQSLNVIESGYLRRRMQMLDINVRRPTSEPIGSLTPPLSITD